MSLYLPRHRAGEGESAVEEESIVEAPSVTGKTVLVVDDEPTVRMLVSEVILGEGYAVLEAIDGVTARKVLQSDVRIDLLITDVGLPGGNNKRQVADAARALRPGLKIPFITGYAENAAIGNGFLGAGMSVLTKPFTVVALARRIHGLASE